jgi:hypothetical protein
MTMPSKEITTMNSTLLDTRLDTTQSATSDQTAFDQAVVATYLTHDAAEAAVRRLSESGVPINMVSIIGRHYQTREDIQGFYRPADAALAGAGQGAWFGGFFGLMAGALGFFVFPVVGALMVLGPLSGMIAGAIGGAGVGALINGLVAAGVPRDQALKYQERLQAGEFLVIVHGSADETLRAHEILDGTAQTHLQTHCAGELDARGHLLPCTRA